MPIDSRVRAWIAWARGALRSAAPADAHPRIELLARVVAGLATLWFAGAAAWEMFGPLASGHWASNAAIGIAAENMWEWKIIGPIANYLVERPTPRSYYCNHPWGIFWTTAPFVKVIGHHAVACRLPAILMSALSPPLLYGIGRQLWGPAAGATAALGFVVTPIALAFANFNNLEVPVMFGVLLASFGYLRLTRTWRRRWLWVSALGFLIAMNGDWPGYFFGAVVLAFGMPRGILLNGRWYPPVDRRRFAQWWALAASIAVAVLLFYFVMFQRSGQLGSLVGAGVSRSAGGALPLEVVLAARSDWIQTSFTWPAILVGKIALPLFVFRLVLLRKDGEIFPLAMLVMAAVQYIVFKQGADIHFFWPQPFALYFGLSLGVSTWTVEALGRALVRRFGRQGMVWPPAIALVLGAVVPILMVPDAIAGLVQARRTGGRFDERGDLVFQDVDKISALDWMRSRLEVDEPMAMHEGMRINWSMVWTLRRQIRGSAVPMSEYRYFIFDTRFAYASEVSQIAQQHAVQAVGPFWLVDRSRGKGAAEGFSLRGRQPTKLEQYFYQGNDPIYTVEADPFVTWELRHHLKQEPNPPPTGIPTTLEQRRIGHNVAVASGDVALAERLQTELTAELDQAASIDFTCGVRLLGTRMEPGLGGRFSIYFLARERLEIDAVFWVEASVTESRRWTFVEKHKRSRATGMPFELPTTLWKPGMIYRSLSEIRPRPGTEEHFGYWLARKPASKLPRSPNGGRVPVLTTRW